MTPERLDTLLENGNPPVILDVRSAAEFSSGHIPGAVHAPLTKVSSLAGNISAAGDGLVVLVCEHGPRAQLARFLLKMSGLKKLELLDGHMSQWRRAGRAVERE